MLNEMVKYVVKHIEKTYKKGVNFGRERVK